MHGVSKSIMWWFGNKDELLLTMDCQSKHLCHINILLLHALRQHPVKTIHEVRQHDIDSGQPKVGARAHPPASPEWCKLKVFPFEVNVRRATTIHEPSGINSAAFSHDFGSPEIAHALMMTIVPEGIV